MAVEPDFEITIELSDVTLTCRAGETVIQCAWRNGYYWPTICGGNGECGACRCEVVENSDNLGAESERETLLFRSIRRTGSSGLPVRFACCAPVLGPVTLRRKGVVRKG